MKKFINTVDDVVVESVQGFCAAHGNIVALGDDAKFVRRADLVDGKVALISGGGSGHEPLHAGFVGRGMLDAACPGAVFTAPTPDQMVAAVQAVKYFGRRDVEPDAVFNPPPVEPFDEWAERRGWLENR